MMSAETFQDFETASRAVLRFLQERYGFGLWMVTRVQDEDWIILQTEDHHYGIDNGTVLKWADSLCSQMTSGAGPRVAPRTRDISAYTDAPISEQLSIGAYVGVPLQHADGELFGTICAIDPSEQPHVSEEDLPLIELLAKLLSTVLAYDIEQAESKKQIRHAQNESLTDPLTGLPNRRAWNHMIEREQGNLERLGGSAIICIVDLDELKIVNDQQGHASGDELLCRCAQAISENVRDQDFVARLGGDEFGVASISHQNLETGLVADRLRAQIAASGVRASVGGAAWRPGQTLTKIWESADAAMYAAKQRDKPQGRR